MLIYDITKEFAQVFGDFVSGFVLGQIGREGYHSLGEISYIGKEPYATGFLQYYDGNLITDGTARITFLCVPEEERGESNAWSLLKEMEKRLKARGIKKAQIRLGGSDIIKLQDYMRHMGFAEKKLDAPVFRTELGMFFGKKLLDCPSSEAVKSLKEVPVREVRRLLHSLPPKELKSVGIKEDISGSDFDGRLSFMYREGGREGLFLTSVVPEGGVLVRLCGITGMASARTVLAMMGEAGRLLTKICAKNTPLYIPLTNDNTKETIERVISDIKLEPVWTGEISYG